MGLETNEITKGDYIFLFGGLHCYIGVWRFESQSSLLCDNTRDSVPPPLGRNWRGALLVVFANELITLILLHPPKRITE